MKRYVVSPLIVTLITLVSFGKVHSQVITNRPGADTMKVVQLINADRLSYKRPDPNTELQMLAGHVQLRQDNTLFYCDSAVFNKNTRFLEAFGNVHIIDNDTVNIRSQYLQYFVDTKMANLKNNVSLTDSKSTLLTNELQYDLNMKIGEYHNGGKLINKESVLTSKEGMYYEELKDVYFKKNVDLKDPKYRLTTDSLLYNTATEIATFVAPTTIIDSSKRVIKTSDGFYDTRNRKAFFGKRPVLNDGAVKIIADRIESDDSSGISKLHGRAVYIDTAQGVSVLANYIEARREDGTFWATQHPLMIIKQEKDSIYITADTLYSGLLSKQPWYNKTDSLKKDSTKQVDSAITKPNVAIIKDSAISIDSVTGKNVAVSKDSTIGKDTAVGKNVVVVKDSTVKDSVVDKKLTVGKDSVAGKKLIAGKKSTVAKKVNKPKTETAKPATVKAAKSADNKNDSTDRFFQAWHHVRIFSDSMQAVSDSLFYSGKDSTFKLFTNPVMWASNSQITGDTIYLYTKNKNPERLYVFENGFAINQSDKEMYNQIKGNRLNGYFTDGAINYMRAQGSAESIYYVKDENNYLVGINNATSDIIDMRFKNKELNKVVFISEVNGTLYPIRQATEQNKLLRNFKWLEERRPKTKFELFEDDKPAVIIDSTKDIDSTQNVDSVKSILPPIPGVSLPKKAPPQNKNNKTPKSEMKLPTSDL